MPYCPWHPLQVFTVYYRVPTLTPGPLCPAQSPTSFPDVHSVLHGPQPCIQMSTVSCTILDHGPGCPVDSSQEMDNKAQARRTTVGSQMGPSCQVSSSLCYNNSTLQGVSFTEQGCWPCVMLVDVRVSGSTQISSHLLQGTKPFLHGLISS